MARGVKIERSLAFPAATVSRRRRRRHCCELGRQGRGCATFRRRAKAKGVYTSLALQIDGPLRYCQSICARRPPSCSGALHPRSRAGRRRFSESAVVNHRDTTLAGPGAAECEPAFNDRRPGAKLRRLRARGPSCRLGVPHLLSYNAPLRGAARVGRRDAMRERNNVYQWGFSSRLPHREEVCNGRETAAGSVC